MRTLGRKEKKSRRERESGEIKSVLDLPANSRADVIFMHETERERDRVSEREGGRGRKVSESNEKERKIDVTHVLLGLGSATSSRRIHLEV